MAGVAIASMTALVTGLAGCAPSGGPGATPTGNAVETIEVIATEEVPAAAAPGSVAAVTEKVSASLRELDE
jgi:hypothetical protein